MMEKLSLTQRSLGRLVPLLPPAARLLYCRQLNTPPARRLHWLLALSCIGQLLWFSLAFVQTLLSWQSACRQGLEPPFPWWASRPGLFWIHCGAAGWALLLLLPLGFAAWSMWDQRHPIRSIDTLRRLPCPIGQLWLGTLLLSSMWLAAALLCQLSVLTLCGILWQWLSPVAWTGFF